LRQKQQPAVIELLQKNGALRYGAHSIINNPGWGGQKARKKVDTGGGGAEGQPVESVAKIKRREAKEAYKKYAEEKWGSANKRVEKPTRRVGLAQEFGMGITRAFPLCCAPGLPNDRLVLGAPSMRMRRTCDQSLVLLELLVISRSRGLEIRL
jgi:hypothetical protein